MVFSYNRRLKKKKVFVFTTWKYGRGWLVLERTLPNTDELFFIRILHTVKAPLQGLKPAATEVMEDTPQR